LGYVIAPKGAKTIFSVCSNNRQHIAIISFACANGWTGLPMLVTPGQPPKNFLTNHLKEAKVCSSKSGYKRLYSL